MFDFDGNWSGHDFAAGSNSGVERGYVVGKQFQSSWYFKYSTSLLRVKRKCLDLQQDPSTKIQIHKVV